MRGFYNIEQKLVIDMLVRRRETKEDDLVEVLKFERKHLRSLIKQMEKDKFIHIRFLMETSLEDGKCTRRNYYSINYGKFVNVVKYRIDHMRRKLETEERDLTSRASFSCKSCGKKFTDLELGKIFNKSGGFICSICDGVVEEVANERPAADSRLIMARFNEQMQPIYTLLQETEAMKWLINEADRNNLTAKSFNHVGTTSNGVNGANANNITNGNISGEQINHDPLANSNVQDTYPITVESLDRFRHNHNNIKMEIEPEVEALLVREENHLNPSTLAHDSSHDEEEPLLPNIIISAGKLKIPVDEVTEDHIVLMTPQQRQDYERTMQQLYSFVYD